MRRLSILYFFHVILTMILLYICWPMVSQSGEEEIDPEFGGIINMRFPGEPRTLNNMTRTDGLAQTVCLFLCPRFLQLDPDTHEFIPFTAASLPEVSKDRKRYTWRIREGLKWDDFEESGAYVTAKDVKFSFELIKHPGTQCPAISDYTHLREIKVLDRYTFEAVYDEASVDAVYKLGHEFRIMPAHLLEDVPAEELAAHSIGLKPVGFGPFKFHHWKKNKEILLIRNDMNREIFPEMFRPYVDGVRFHVIPDSDMVWNQFLRQEIDICGLTADDWKYKTKKPEFTQMATIHQYYLPWWSYIAWNNESRLFEDARVRRAMTHMVRREEILATHRYGLGKVLSGPFWCFSRAYDPSIEPLPYDPEASKRLLKDAGWDDHDGDGILDRAFGSKVVKFEFEFVLSSLKIAYRDALLMALQQDLEAIGVIMRIRRLESSAFKKMIKERNFDAMTSGFRNFPVFEDPYGYWHSSVVGRPGNNNPGYRNPAVDRLLEQVRLEFDEEERYKLLRKVHAAVHEDQPATFLYSFPSLVGINNRWRNVKIHKTGVFFYEWWLPEENRKPSDKVPRQ